MNHAPQSGCRRGVLMTTCQVQVTGPDGSTAQVRALLDTGSSTSYASERLAQRLCLPRREQNAPVDVVGAAQTPLSPRGKVRLSIGRVGSGSKIMMIEALVLRKITTNVPHRPVVMDRRWRHLNGLKLADPGFGVPGGVDLLLGVDVFNRTLLHGRRFGPWGSPSAFKTRFGWVLVGEVQGSRSSPAGTRRQPQPRIS